MGKAEELINKNVHPTVIVEGYYKAADKALNSQPYTRSTAIAKDLNIRAENSFK